MQSAQRTPVPHAGASLSTSARGSRGQRRRTLGEGTLPGRRGSCQNMRPALSIKENDILHIKGQNRYTSEIRLVEILETLCESSSFECNRMVEEHEEHFETWWFRWKTEHPDLFKWFCINTIKVCCPKGTYGPDCNACVGGSERPCHGNGLCDGDGTRGGQGTCTCNHGYQGELCLDCVEGYFSEERNDTHAICTECHTSCKTCAGPSNGDCEDCKAGWEKDQQGACIAPPHSCLTVSHCYRRGRVLSSISALQRRSIVRKHRWIIFLQSLRQGMFQMQRGGPRPVSGLCGGLSG
ncbi:cysteine-rich with EGF-like domain protein 2 isoform X4 [Scleropages formosus]|uniref:cysteine-rich with EGF-like domain protein 2 isoform X4 n=1 Tax=Scleropages formosus TaxID=113540 RepID=UPI0010FAB619|nr:cysteine-rich with EGF-like domain protein 2 isoform X4 [Scleropages formosus]